MTDHRVIVCGSRDSRDRERVFDYLTGYHHRHPITLLITGACADRQRKGELRGVDRWATEWAVVNEVPFVGMPAQWTKYAKPAGMIRNRAMVQRWRPHACIGFPGGNGTRNCLEECRKFGAEVVEVQP